MRESRRQRHSSQICHSTCTLALPTHCTDRMSLVPPPMPTTVVLAASLFASAPTTCSVAALASSHTAALATDAGASACAPPMPRSLACSPVARQPLPRQSLACLLARLLARSSARSLALPHLPPARPSTSPPQTHDCPAVMGLRLVFVSGGGSPWFNVDWSFS